MSWDFWGDQSKKTASYAASKIGGTEPEDPTKIQNENTSIISSTGIISSNGLQCFDSRECGSGWACVGGRCIFLSGAVQSSQNTESGTTAGCGSGINGSGSGSGDAPGGGGGGCAAGTGGGGGSGGGGCTKTGAGDCGSSGGGGGGGGADDCCGDTRCCRAGGCSCGPCPPPNNCSQFCAAQKSSTGDSGAGCNPDNECDECSSCQQEDETGEYKCLPQNGGPCNCPGGRECEGCTSCNENGTCVDDSSRCLDCCNCFLECPCGVRVEQRVCIPHVTTGAGCVTVCRQELSCDEACPPSPIEPCGCNCNDDCGECEICNSKGECEYVCDCKTKEEDCPYCHECNEDKTACRPQETADGDPWIDCGDGYCCPNGDCLEDREGFCCQKRFATKPYIYTCLNSVANCVEGSLFFTENENEACCVDACDGTLNCRTFFCGGNNEITSRPDPSLEIGDCCKESQGKYHYA